MNIIVAVLCILMFTSFALPVMSIFIPGEYVFGELAVHGFNFVEFTFIGVIPVVCTCLIFILAIISDLSIQKCFIMKVAIVLSTISYVYSFFKAKEFILTISDFPIEYKSGTFVSFILAVSTFIAISKIRRNS